MTDEEFDTIGKQLAETFGDKEMPFVLVAIDQSGTVNRNHCCSNLSQHEALEVIMDIVIRSGMQPPQEQ